MSKPARRIAFDGLIAPSTLSLGDLNWRTNTMASAAQIDANRRNAALEYRTKN